VKRSRKIKASERKFGLWELHLQLDNVTLLSYEDSKRPADSKKSAGKKFCFFKKSTHIF
jgi:hypothetical protein